MFRVGAVLGGMAKRGSEILAEERKEAMETVNEQLKVWTEMGLPKARARKEQLRTRNKIFDDLSSEGFSNVQIAVIMGEGKGQAVMDHIQNQRNTYKDFQVRPADIVAISPDYKDTGLTKDIILNNVMGEVQRGKDVTDAVNKLSGNDGTLTSLLGGNLAGIQKAKMDAFSVAAGVDADELRALAADDIRYDKPLVEGTVTMSDPAARKRAQDALEANTAGLFTSPSFYNNIMSLTAPLAGVTADIDAGGSIIYKPQQDQRNITASGIVRDILADYYKSTDKNKFTFVDISAVMEKIQAELDAAGILMTGTGAGAGAGAGAGSGSSTTTPPAATNPFAGLGSQQNVITQAIRQGKGASTSDQTLILGQARAALIAMGVSAADADKAVEEIRKGF